MKTFRTLSLAVTVALLFPSCFDDLYGAINNEVELEDSGLQGDINQIVRFDDYIVIANGDIYYKTNEPSSTTGLKNGQWKRMANPTNEKGDYDVPATTYFVASDDEYLYALTYIWMENDDGENEPEYAKLYYTSSVTGSWSLLDLVSAGIIDDWSYGNVKILFDNQYCGTMDDASTEDAYKDLTNRRAYIRALTNSSSTYTIYLLDGENTELTEIDTSNDNWGGATSSDWQTTAITACYYDGADWFSKFYGMTANSEYLYYTGTYTYYNTVYSSSVLYYTNGSTQYESSVGAGGLLSLAAMDDYILLGTTSGLARATLSSYIPTGSSPDFDNNGDSVISEYVFMVFALDPSKQEGSTTNGTDEYGASIIKGSISSSSDSWDDAGLYAYYPSRDEWNRDGD